MQCKLAASIPIHPRRVTSALRSVPIAKLAAQGIRPCANAHALTFEAVRTCVLLPGRLGSLAIIAWAQGDLDGLASVATEVVTRPRVLHGWEVPDKYLALVAVGS